MHHPPATVAVCPSRHVGRFATRSGLLRGLLLLLLGLLLPLSALQAQEAPTVVCPPLQLTAGETAPMPCTVRGAGAVVYRWESAEGRHLRRLSSLSVLRPLFTAPSEVTRPLRVTYTLVMETVGGAPLGQALVQVAVRPRTEGSGNGAPILAHGPLQVTCPPTLVLHAGERRALACRASDPSGAPLRYTWQGDLSIVPRAVPHPTVVAPQVLPDQGPRTFPLTLTVTSERSRRTAHAQVTVTVLPRDLSLSCPTRLAVDAGAAVVLACHSPDAAATYRWTGLWGTSVAPLSRTDLLAPTFTAPPLTQAKVFDYVVRMQSGGRFAQHRVTVQVRPLPVDVLSCAPLTLPALARRPLPCHVPAGHRLRWRNLAGPSAPHLTPQHVTAPWVEADTTFIYPVEACPVRGGPCVRGGPWNVTVQRQKPPAVSCTANHDTYAGEADLVLHCSTSGGTALTYAWTGTDTERLSATDVLTPTFDVPGQVAEDTDYAYTLTVTDPFTGAVDTEVHILVRPRGVVTLDCDRLEYFVHAGSADFSLQPACTLAGAPEGGYVHRWYAHSARDAARLSDTQVRHPRFAVPDTLVAPTTYVYIYAAAAQYADPGSVEVHVNVTPFPAAFDMTVRTTALDFAEQAAGGQVTLDPVTGHLSAKVRGAHAVGRMILVSDAVVEAGVELAGGRLHPQSGGAPLSLTPRWAVSVACVAPAAETLASGYATIQLGADRGGCRVVHFGGVLDLRHAVPGPYAGTLDVILRNGAVQETFLMPVSVRVVAPHRTVTTGPQGTHVGPEGRPRMTAVQQVRIHPPRALLTTAQPYGTFTLHNPSMVTQEISVQPVFGYTEARADGAGETVVQVPTAAVGDLGSALVIYPKVFTLGPAETRQVHYALREDARLAGGAYATFLEFGSRPRRYVRTDQLPTPDDSARVAHVTLRIQGAYIPAQTADRIMVSRLPDDRLLLEATGGPFEGTVIATDATGREVGRRRLLLLTTRMVRWPLEGGVTLRFVTSQGAAPPPVNLP